MIDQCDAGGPRAGGGAAAVAATMSAGLPCSSRPWNRTGSGWLNIADGGALPTMHSGQSSAAGALLVLPSALSTILTMPLAALQISTSLCGFTSGDASAAPSVKANHSSAKRASQGVLRRVCRKLMGRDYGIDTARQVAPAPRLLFLDP